MAIALDVENEITKGNDMLTLNGVTKSYGKRDILSDITHEFQPGLNLLVGPSGAGKSTLLRLCATVEKPSSGKLLWHNKPYTNVRKKLRFELGYAPQIVDLPQDVTGMEFLAHIAALKGLEKRAKTQAFEILAPVSYTHLTLPTKA